MNSPAFPKDTAKDAAKDNSGAAAGSPPFPTTSEQPHGKLSASEAPPAAADMVDRLAQGAHATIDRVASQASPVAERLQRNLHGAEEKWHQGVDELRHTSEEWTKTLRCTVCEHPLAALGTAALLGLLIARLSSR